MGIFVLKDQLKSIIQMPCTISKDPNTLIKVKQKSLREQWQSYLQAKISLKSNIQSQI